MPASTTTAKICNRCNQSGPLVSLANGYYCKACLEETMQPRAPKAAKAPVVVIPQCAVCLKRARSEPTASGKYLCRACAAAVEVETPPTEAALPGTAKLRSKSAPTPARGAAANPGPKATSIVATNNTENLVPCSARDCTKRGTMKRAINGAPYCRACYDMLTAALAPVAKKAVLSTAAAAPTTAAAPTPKAKAQRPIPQGFEAVGAPCEFCAQPRAFLRLLGKNQLFCERCANKVVATSEGLAHAALGTKPAETKRLAKAQTPATKAVEASWSLGAQPAKAVTGKTVAGAPEARPTCVGCGKLARSIAAADGDHYCRQCYATAGLV